MIRAMVIDRAEADTGEDAGWMRDIAALGRGAFLRLLGFFSFARLQGSAPTDLTLLAGLGAVMAEDCGPCTRIGARYAKRLGLAPDKLRAALAGGVGLAGAGDLAYRFGRAVASGDPAADELGTAIEAQFGRGVRTELTVTAATSRVYPAIKRGLGYARSCSLTRFDDL